MAECLRSQNLVIFPSIFTGSLNDPFLAISLIVLIHSHLCVHIPSTSRLAYRITCQNGNMYMTSKTHVHWWTSNIPPGTPLPGVSPHSIWWQHHPSSCSSQKRERKRDILDLSFSLTYQNTTFSSSENIQASLQNTSSLLSLFLPQLPLLILFTVIFLWYYCSHYCFHPCTQV